MRNDLNKLLIVDPRKLVDSETLVHNIKKMSNPDYQVLLRSFTPVDFISDEEINCLHVFPRTGSEKTQDLS